jgi:DNA repair protein RadA/Sms
MSIYTCPSCGHQSPKYFPRCPACAKWLDPDQVAMEENDTDLVATDPEHPAQPATESELEEPPRIKSGLNEIDRVLGGGVSKGSALLFTGAPGVGKSTLLMQVAAMIAAKHGPVLYVSAEESLPQAAARAKRINAAHADLFILSDNGLEETVAEMNRLNCAVVVIDSLQLMRTRYSDTAPGTAVQVKEVSARLTELAKKRGVPILVAGQIIKTGKFAGPMSVPHLYDGVFHLDENTLPGFILLRVEKNRFGSKAEVGSLRMTAHGIEEVPSPSAELLKGGGKGIIAVAMEGTKPIATEIQVGFLQRADLSEAIVGYPKDRLRLIQTILAGYGIEIPSSMALDVLGGYKIADPAADLAVAIASIFAAKATPIPKCWAAIGEVALDGRLIPPKDFIERYREVEILGIEHIIVPHIGSDSLPPSQRVQTFRARTLREALKIVGAEIDEKHAQPGRPKETRETKAVSAAPAPQINPALEKKRERLAEPKVDISTPQTRSATAPVTAPVAVPVSEPVADKPQASRDLALARLANLKHSHGILTSDLIRRELNVSVRRAHELLATFHASSVTE